MTFKTLKNTTINMFMFPPRLAKSIYNYYYERKMLWREFFIWKKYGPEVYKEIKILEEYNAKYELLLSQSNLPYDQTNNKIAYHFFRTEFLLNIINDLIINQVSLLQHRFTLPKEIEKKNTLLRKYDDLMTSIEKFKYPLSQGLLELLEQKQQQVDKQGTITKLNETRLQEKQAYENTINANQQTNENIHKVKQNKIDELTNQLGHARARLIKLKTLLNKKNATIQELETQAKNNTCINLEKDETTKKLENELYVLSYRFKSLTENNEHLTAQLRQLKNIEQRYENLVKDLAQLKQENVSLNSQFNIKNLEALDLLKQVTSYQNEETTVYVSLKTKLVQKEADIQRLTLENKEYEKICKDRDIMVKDLRSEVRKKDENLLALHTNYESLEQQNNELQEQKQLIQSEKLQMQRLNTKLTLNKSDFLLKAEKSLTITLNGIESMHQTSQLPLQLIIQTIDEISQSSDNLTKLKDLRQDAHLKALNYWRELQSIADDEQWYTKTNSKIPEDFTAKKENISNSKKESENERDMWDVKIQTEKNKIRQLVTSNQEQIQKLNNNLNTIDSQLAETKTAFREYREILETPILNTKVNTNTVTLPRSTNKAFEYFVPKTVFTTTKNLSKQISDGEGTFSVLPTNTHKESSANPQYTNNVVD